MRQIYNKLVRDKIPKICKKDGEVPKYYILNQARFKKELKKKLIEESRELVRASKDKLKNEIVDVYEILLNLAKTFGIKWQEIEKFRKEKNRKRGSFKKRYFLVSSKK